MNIWTAIGLALLGYGLTRNEPLRRQSVRKQAPRRNAARTLRRSSMRQMQLKEPGLQGEKQINDAINAEGKKVIFFLAGWCGHCRKLLDNNQAQLRKIAGGLEHPVYFTDLGKDKALASLFGVSSYPTIRIYTARYNAAGKLTGTTKQEYTGSRDAAGLKAALGE